MRLTLSYAGFLVLAGGLLGGVLIGVLRYLPDENLAVVGSGDFAPSRSDLLDVAVPLAVWCLVFLALVGLIGGWFLAGRMLRPLAPISAAARATSAGSLTHRIRLPGPDDELSRLADAFDLMLDRLQHAFEEQRRFTANASHELRTPQTVMKTLIQVARADPTGTDVDALLERLEITNERSIRMIESLLQLARLDHASIEVEPCDLAEVVADAAEQTDEVRRGRDVQVTTDTDRAVLVGNGPLLAQLASNLLHNAITHNLATGGQVWVRTSTDASGRAVLAVENTGAPITPGAEHRLLEPFVRDAERTQRGPRAAGSGLGLAIVASIARVHDAALDLRARPEGGLLVTVTFPAPTSPA